MKPGPLRRAMGVALVVGMLAAACGSGDAGGVDGDASRGVPGDVIVFAAASLTEAFEGVGDAFMAANPDVEVVFNHAGSQTLAAQINEGAPADVFASADTMQMDLVAAEGNLAGAPAIFTANRSAIAVEPGNPLGIDGLADLADPKVLLVLPSEEVPAGRYARQALQAADVEVAPASLERDVRAALSKVELGEADAAIVYASDIVASDGRAEGVAIPVAENTAASYPIAVLDDAPNPTAAAAFRAFVLSADGQAILVAHGFTAS